MGAELRIESEYDRAWELHGPEHRKAVAARENFRTEIHNRLGPDTAADVQHHVDVALGRLLADDLPDLPVAAERAFHQLLALERAVIEIKAGIELKSTFFDPYNDDGLLPTLGLSWWEDVLPLVEGQQSPGYMRPENVRRFLVRVTNAKQRLPKGTADHLRERRQELIEFLERAVELREPLWCDL